MTLPLLTETLKTKLKLVLRCECIRPKLLVLILIGLSRTLAV